MYINPLVISGIVFNSSYLLGVVFPDASGLSLLPWITLFLLFYLVEVKLRAKHITAMILVIVLYYIGIFSSDFNQYSIYKSQMFIVKAIPMMLVPFILRRKLTKFLVGYSIPIAGLLIISAASSLSMFSTVNVNDRLEIGVFNPIWISRSAIELFILTAIIFRLKIFYLVIISAVIIPVIYTAGSKGPVVSAIVVFMLWYYSKFGANIIQRAGTLFVICFVSLTSVWALSFIDTESYLYQRFLLQIPDGSESLGESRGVIWPLAIDRILNQDFLNLIFGVGIGGYEKLLTGASSGERIYPHNIILELLIENGLFATVGLLILALYAYKRSESPLKYIFIYYLINAQFSGDMLLNEYLFFYAAAMVSNYSSRSPKQIIQRQDDCIQKI